MRTPNTECLLCKKPLYRRPHEIAKVRYAACMSCRGRAQSVVGVTDAQRDGLSLGCVKGTNHRSGYSHRTESKLKCADSNRAHWAANPEAAAARGAKIRGELNVRWNGGSSRLNTSLRQMTENRRWMDAVKERDGACLRCGSTNELESHYRVELAELIELCGIKSRDDARRHADVLWDLSNGKALCRSCHWAEHGRVAA
jgi:hypothetical protein